MSDYNQHLLSYLDPSKIMTLSCGHVIPPSNLLAVPVVQTLSGTDFEFTFEKRNSEKMVYLLSRPTACRLLNLVDDRSWKRHLELRKACT